jgi:hypothetical protein
MLQRNVLYTGVTRAKKLAVLVGSGRALAVAVRTKGRGRCTPRWITAAAGRVVGAGSQHGPFGPLIVAVSAW